MWVHVSIGGLICGYTCVWGAHIWEHMYMGAYMWVSMRMGVTYVVHVSIGGHIYGHECP